MEERKNCCIIERRKEKFKHDFEVPLLVDLCFHIYGDCYHAYIDIHNQFIKKFTQAYYGYDVNSTHTHTLLYVVIRIGDII